MQHPTTAIVPDYCYASLAEVDAAIDTLLRPVGATVREYIAHHNNWAFIHPSTGVVKWPHRTDGVPIVNAADFLAQANELEKVGKPGFENGRLLQYANFIGTHEHVVFLDAAAFNAAMAPLLRARAELVLAMKRAEAAAVLPAQAPAEAALQVHDGAEAVFAPTARAIAKRLAKSRVR